MTTLARTETEIKDKGHFFVLFKKILESSRGLTKTRLFGVLRQYSGKINKDNIEWALCDLFSCENHYIVHTRQEDDVKVEYESNASGLLRYRDSNGHGYYTFDLDKLIDGKIVWTVIYFRHARLDILSAIQLATDYKNKKTRKIDLNRIKGLNRIKYKYMQVSEGNKSMSVLDFFKALNEKLLS